MSAHRARVIYADPPWEHSDLLPGNGRGAAKHYDCMTADQIARFPLPPLMDDAWLFMWRLHTHQDEARFVMRAWGFNYASELVWVKMTNDCSRVRIGMGRTVRNAHEVCLIGKRGKIKPNSLAIPSAMLLPRGEHSAKPVEMYDVIERLAHGPYVELFARAERRGWESYGNELKRAAP